MEGGIFVSVSGEYFEEAEIRDEKPGMDMFAREELVGAVGEVSRV